MPIAIDDVLPCINIDLGAIYGNKNLIHICLLIQEQPQIQVNLQIASVFYVVAYFRYYASGLKLNYCYREYYIIVR